MRNISSTKVVWELPIIIIDNISISLKGMVFKVKNFLDWLFLPTCLVLIARQVGRENQTKKFFTLNTIPLKEIDMLSIIIIGNSQTTLVDEIFLTPRGYLQN